MADHLQDMDWDGTYRGDTPYGAEPPWNIGEPQPELAALIDAGRVRSEVLDAGCGHAELSLTLAAQGYTVTGIDLSPTAIAAATAAARDRELSGVEFVADDITTFEGFDGRFSTVMDSTLFHSLPIDGRDGYVQAVHRAAAPGASYFILVFAKGAFPPDLEQKPNEVTEDELRDVVGRYWEIDEVRPAFIHANMPAEMPLPSDARDDKGRAKMSGLLLTAHKSG
ncbi:MAG: methyltransferase domain-containing protein [Mycobacterium kyogaense]|uniref:class I SAM-dependent methyltransferase n=1 Tax=Mycobacterium kyogaense TaxID=2212479 RepID=UPI002FFB1314